MSSPVLHETTGVNSSGPPPLTQVLLLHALFTVLIAFVILGNGTVVLIVCCSRSMRSVSSILITSLAASDLCLGLLVLPFAQANDTRGLWTFGPTWCMCWLALDVWMSTCSIFNLMIISIDRYIAITRPLVYPSIVTRKRGRQMVCVVWLLSFIVAFPPVVSWSDFASNSNKQCTVLGFPVLYILLSSLTSFYFPMFIIIVLYGRIYCKVREVTKTWHGGSMSVKIPQDSSQMASQSETRSTKYGLMKRVSSNMLKLSQPATSAIPTVDQPQHPNEKIRLHRGGYTSTRVKEKPVSKPSVSRFQTLLETSDHNSSLRRNSTTSATAGKPEPQTPSLNVPQSTRSRSASICNATIDLNWNRESLGRRGESAHSTKLHRISMKLSNSAPQDSPFARKRSERTRMLAASPIMSILREIRPGYQRRLAFEIHALKSVSIITGCFFACWIGFSFCYVIKAFEPHLIPDSTFAAVSYLGYLNSALNPFIYALFSNEFRRALQKVKDRIYRKLTNDKSDKFSDSHQQKRMDFKPRITTNSVQ